LHTGKLRAVKLSQRPPQISLINLSLAGKFGDFLFDHDNPAAARTARANTIYYLLPFNC
jgi:hypothetical protein